MGADQHFDWRAGAASVLDWWRDAGVDTLVDESPRDWLARTRAPSPAAAPIDEPAAPPLPATLEDFVAWRTTGDVPEARWGGTVHPPEGDARAALMVVVDCPGDERLVDGAAGRLLDAMLAAISLDRSSIYLSALALARPLGGRIPPEDLTRLSELLRHHIALAAPKRLLLLGQAPSRAIVGMNGQALPHCLQVVNLNGTTVQAVASHHPRFLLEHPRTKGEAWRDLQLLGGGLS